MQASLRRLEVFPIRLRLKIDHGWKQQYHVPALVHDGCAAISTADLARQLMYRGLFRALIPTEIMVTVCKVDVIFVKDSGPLEWCS